MLTGKVCAVLANHGRITDVLHRHRVCCQATFRGGQILLYNTSARTAEHKGESESEYICVEKTKCLFPDSCSPLLFLKIFLYYSNNSFSLSLI